MPMRSSRVRRFTALSLVAAGLLWPIHAQAAPPTKELQQQLIHAVLQDQITTVQDLLQRGGDPNARVAPGKEDAWALEHINDNDPAPPLIVLACRFGSIQGPKVIQSLIDKGANVNAADRNGVTPLMVASELGMGSVDLLLEHGAKVNVRDNAGKTPLMYAMQNRGLNTAALLLEKGADINAQDKAGSTPLMAALRGASSDPVLLFGEDQTKKDREAKARYEELIAFLVEKKADLNRRDKAGNTALKLAIAQQNQTIIQLLRKAGAKE